MVLPLLATFGGVWLWKKMFDEALPNVVVNNNHCEPSAPPNESGVITGDIVNGYFVHDNNILRLNNVRITGVHVWSDIPGKKFSVKLNIMSGGERVGKKTVTQSDPCYTIPNAGVTVSDCHVKVETDVAGLKYAIYTC